MRSILSATVLFLACAAPQLLDGQALGPASKADASPAAANLLPFQSVTLNAAAEWFAGLQHLTGTAVLQANVDGSSKEQFDLGSASWTFMQSKADAARACQWTDADKKAHEVAGANCFQALPWFAPQLFGQAATVLPSVLSVTDDGNVIRDGVRFRQLRYTYLQKGHDSVETTQRRERSAVKVLFDLRSILPSRLEYSLHPDLNDLENLDVLVTFSDYRLTSGLMLPFHIERSVNRTLQMKLDISAVTAK